MEKAIYYRVQKEESIIEIANKFCVPPTKIIKDNNLKIYFSANDVKRTHIGLLEGDDCTQFQLVEFGKFRTFFSFAKYFIAKKMISICFITKQLFKRF